MAYAYIWAPSVGPLDKIVLGTVISRDARYTCDRCSVRNQGSWGMSTGPRLRELSIVQPDDKCYWRRKLCPHCIVVTMAQLQKVEIEIVQSPVKAA